MDPGLSQKPSGGLQLRGAQRRAWPTPTGAPSHDFTLPGERRVAVSGDWESRTAHVLALLQRLGRDHPDIQTILHVGDLRWETPMRLGNERIYKHDNFLPRLEAELNRLGLRLLLTPGNHDAWSVFEPAFAAHPDRPRRLSPSIWAFPRGFRFALGDARFMSFGGAVSVDADRDPAEAPSDEDVLRASVSGRVDVLLTHEPPNAGIASIDALIASNPHRWSPVRLRLSAQSRARIDAVADAVSPSLLVHGHMHVAGSSTAESGRRTVALPALPHAGNTVILDLASLSTSALGNSRPDQTAAPHPGPPGQLSDGDRRA